MVILGYGSCLYLHRYIVPISPQALLALVVAYMTLAAAAFFIELTTAGVQVPDAP